MTYICRPCSARHNIPRREDRPEVGICPICQDVHALYLVKREPVPDASPWVPVGAALPEPGEMVVIAWRPERRGRRVGWITHQRTWCTKLGVRTKNPPDYWCPIPPLPPRC